MEIITISCAKNSCYMGNEKKFKLRLGTQMGITHYSELSFTGIKKQALEISSNYVPGFFNLV